MEALDRGMSRAILVKLVDGLAVQCRRVLRDELASRAASRGRSMQELLRTLERLAARPDVWLHHVHGRKRATRSNLASGQILKSRDADTR